MKKLLTLCMVVNTTQILLGMKKRGFGVGRWNGFGGKVGDGESIDSAALRELQEEAGIIATEIHKVGVLNFSHDSDTKQLEVHVYIVNSFSGSPIESDEMRPEWFTFDTIPYNQMWPDDKEWLPYLLAGKHFKGTFHFDRPSDAEYQAKILSQTLEVVEHL